MSFRDLLNGLYPQNGPRVLGWIELRARRPDKSVERRWASSVDSAILEATKLNELVQASVYFGVNPRGERDSHEEAVKHVITVVADVDFEKQERKFSQPESYFKQYGLNPSAIVATGHGAHAYWFLDTPVDNTPEFKEVRKEFQHLGGSDSIHDAGRVLRAPGTKNPKNPDEVVTATLLECNSNRRYSATIFEKIPRLSPKIRDRLYTGGLQGFRSRSERDWGIVREMVDCGFTDEEILLVFSHSKASDRYVERWPTLLQYDIDRAREMIDLGEGNAGAVEITEHDSCYYRRVEGGTKKISTFIFEPIALLQSEDASDEDRLLGNIRAEGTEHVWPDVQIPRSAFTDRRSLAKHLPTAAWSWLGSDVELVHLLPYLMRRIQANRIPMVRMVKSLGRYGSSWVHEKGVITSDSDLAFSEAGYMYGDKGQTHPILNYNEAEDAATKIRHLSKLLPSLNRPQVIWPCLGWLFATFYKPILNPMGRQFPILQVIGSRGAGKTTLVRNVLLPMVGYDKPEGYSCDTTDFVVLTLLGFSTSIPVFFAEYRSSLPTAERFLRRLRLSYDSGTDARGHGNQTTTSYPIVTPVVLDGENPADEPAILERSVITMMSPEDLTDERRDVYKATQDIQPYGMAREVVKYSLQREAPVHEARRLVAEAFRDRRMPDRVEHNMDTIATGLLLYYGFCKRFEAYCPKITSAFVREVLSDTISQVTMAETGRTRIAADEFIEDIINTVARLGGGNPIRGGGCSGVSPFSWRYDRGEDELSFHLSSALNWWAVSRRKRGMSTLNTSTVRMQLRERAQRKSAGLDNKGQYITGAGMRYFTGLGAINCYTISIQIASEAGLDVPRTLHTMMNLNVSKVPLN